MNYLRNHCWCSKSNWNGGMFDCQIIVSLSSYEEHDKEDWGKMIGSKDYLDQEKYDLWKRTYPDKDEKYWKALSKKHCTTLNQDVYDWLCKEIPDGKNGIKMWCIGNDEYNSNNSCEFSLFFQRRKDAMKFISVWSKWKKPVLYTQYFTDVRKELNLETMKYEDRG